MAIHIIQSHKLSLLFDTLCQLGFKPQQDMAEIFQSKHIIVPNDAVQAWLSQRLAEQQGISANIQYHQGISSFQWFIYQQLAKTRDDVRNANLPRLVIKWQIYHDLHPFIQSDELNLTSSEPLHPLLQRIYERGKAFLQPKQRYQARQKMLYWVAEQISRVFRYYLIYRREWLQQWSAGKMIDVERYIQRHDDAKPVSEIELQRAKEIATWQGFLWHRLFAERFQQIVQVEQQFWRNAQDTPAKLPSPLVVFTLLDLAPAQLDFLRQLAQYTNVVIFHFNPTQEYWADSVDPRWKQQQDIKIKERIRQKFPEFNEQQFQQYFASLSSSFNPEIRDSRHPLLTRFGKQARDHFSLLSHLADGSEGQWVDLFDDPQTHTPQFAQGILGRLQHDIFYLLDPQQSNYDLQPNDESLKIHVCHSPLRQLEVLKEQLLYWLSQGTAEQPRSPQDILVLTPELGELEPTIRAVFHRSLQHLPIYLSGTLPADVQQAWQSVLYRITWVNSRFSIQHFSDWLHLSATQQFYAIDEHQLQRMLHLLKKTGFKRGFDETHLKQQLAEHDDDYRFSFKYAIDRLAMGLAVPEIALCPTEDGQILSDNNVLLTDIACINTLLRIYDDFAQRRSWLDESAYPNKTVLAWLQQLLQELDDWQLAGVEHLALIRETIKKYDTMLSLSYHTQALYHYDEISSLKSLRLPLSEILQEIQQQLATHIEHAEPSGAITFSQIGQIRPLPYKLIVLLNLDGGTFPARDRPASFDLMQLLNSKLGDRSRLDDHQGAFLDCLLLAEQALWLFYTGFDADSHDVLDPSTVVQEFVQHLSYLVRPTDSPDRLTQVKKQGISIPAHLQSLYLIHPSEPFVASGFADVHLHRFKDQWFTVAQQLNSLNPNATPAQHWLNHQLNYSSSATPRLLDAQTWIKDLEFPARALLRHLNVHNDTGASVQQDFETLLPNKLQSYQFKHTTLQGLMYPELDSQHLYLESLADLPIGHLSEIVWQDALEFQQQTQERLNHLGLTVSKTTQRTWQTEITLPTQDVQTVLFHITIPEQPQTTTWCSVTASSIEKKKYRLHTWLNHLLWLAYLNLGDEGKTYQSIFVGSDCEIITTGVSSRMAQQYLTDWFHLWLYAQQRPMVLSASLIFNNMYKKNDNDWNIETQPVQLSQAMLGKIIKSWTSTSEHGIPLAQNDANRQHHHWQFILQGCDDLALLQQNVQDFAWLYYPLICHQQKIEHKKG